MEEELGFFLGSSVETIRPTSGRSTASPGSACRPTQRLGPECATAIREGSISASQLASEAVECDTASAMSDEVIALAQRPWKCDRVSSL